MTIRKPFSAHRLLTLAALLAALPAAAAPDNITDLGTLKSDNSSHSDANAISADGSVVAGLAQSDSDFFSRASVWSGSGWSNKTDLGTLKNDNSGFSTAQAVSRDGSVVAGQAERDIGEPHAAIWSGSGWSTKTDLGTLRSDNSGRSEVRAVSDDASVVVGNAQHDNDPYSEHATVWSGSGWTTKTDLGTLSSDNSGWSQAYAVSGDGSVIVGDSRSDFAYVDERATVWSGSGWSTKTDLGTLKADNSAGSEAYAVSGDGLLVAGRAATDNGETHATVWSGNNWGTKTDLGTLKADNSGGSAAWAVSSDGNFAVGFSFNDEDDTRAVVWNLRNLNNARPTDTANTRASLSPLSADTASLLAQRARAAENLLGGCRADGGKFCYSAGYRRDIGHGASSRGADFAFGYGFTDNFDAAVSLAVPARAEENGSHRLKSGVGIGLSARLHNGAGWYAVPAAAFETDKNRIRRPHLNGTESPENTVRTKGRAYSLTAGRDYGTPGEKTLGWYAALRRTEAERPSYSEDAGLSFPFAYGAAKLKETSLAAGIKGRLPLIGKLAWYGNAEVAQRVGGGKAHFTAEAPFFGKYETERETSRTRPSVQTGVDYAFSPSAVLSLGGYVGRNAFSGTDKGMFLKLNGKF